MVIGLIAWLPPCDRCRESYHWIVRWMRWAPIAVVITASLALSSVASALVLAPPGHAGANQYFEVIPTSAGNAAPPGSVRGSGNASAGSQALAPFGHGSKGDAKLAKLGKDGRAAAAVVAATAPGTVPAGARADAYNNGTSPEGSAAHGIATALGGSDAGGLGLLLPLLLATALIVALGIVAARMRRRPGSPVA
jgi:hypothetical protein